jgi:hypothetical protein
MLGMVTRYWTWVQCTQQRRRRSPVLTDSEISAYHSDPSRQQWRRLGHRFHTDPVVWLVHIGVSANPATDGVLDVVVAEQRVVARQGEELIGPRAAEEQITTGASFEVVVIARGGAPRRRSCRRVGSTLNVQSHRLAVPKLNDEQVIQRPFRL